MPSPRSVSPFSGQLRHHNEVVHEIGAQSLPPCGMTCRSPELHPPDPGHDPTLRPSRRLLRPGSVERPRRKRRAGRGAGQDRKHLSNRTGRGEGSHRREGSHNHGCRAARRLLRCTAHWARRTGCCSAAPSGGSKAAFSSSFFGQPLDRISSRRAARCRVWPKADDVESVFRSGLRSRACHDRCDGTQRAAANSPSAVPKTRWLCCWL